MENLLSKIQSKFSAEILKTNKNEIWIKIEDKDLLNISISVKESNFEFFSSLSAIDFPEKNRIELVYHIWNEKDKVLLNIKTEIEREKPKITSISEIYACSQIHEREVHELFGIKFLGNPDLSELFLEDWQERPPFLKDFDSQNYVRENFYNKNKKSEKNYFGQ
ncbi:MAG: NADH-quinone oxidoreductase subunit C [Patescibacteria group bacterium]|nr:NADH-quinone oxidoreductase subunit C [Patescibacteria group bacterium]